MLLYAFSGSLSLLYGSHLVPPPSLPPVCISTMSMAMGDPIAGQIRSPNSPSSAAHPWPFSPRVRLIYTGCLRLPSPIGMLASSFVSFPSLRGITTFQCLHSAA